MVTFYELGNNGKPANPVLFLDTLKVSTIEQTAETSEARGGKGNAALIMWDYGKEINVTLEDALFSAKSMAIMFGNGKTKAIKSSGIISGDTNSNNKKLVMKTVVYTPSEDEEEYGQDVTDQVGKKFWEDANGALHEIFHARYYTADGTEVLKASIKAKTKYFCTFDIAVQDDAVIEISANSFPGTYYVVGETFARSEASGKDEMFQFIIPKAKVLSENTITLEAEGDPSVFNMNLRVMRPADGIMMKLVKYEPTTGITLTEASTSDIVHNHQFKIDAAG